jgi:hypothetical protein
MFNHRRVAPNQPEAIFGEEKGSQRERTCIQRGQLPRGQKREGGSRQEEGRDEF